MGPKHLSYDPGDVDKAAELVKNKTMSLNKVYGIPKTTLHDRVSIMNISITHY